MAKKSMAYDHAAYLVPLSFSGLSAVGASGVTTKWAAYTAMQLKAVVHSPVIATTAAGSQPLLFKKTGTTTTTTTLTILTSAASAAIVDDITAVTLARGDQFWYTHGTDATAAVAVAIEANLVPGSDVTV